MVGKERVGVLVGHVVGQVVPGVSHQDGEESEADEHRIEDVIGADRQTLPLGLERVAGMTVELDDLDFLRCRHRSAGSFLFHALGHSGSEIPCARMNRKCTYMSRTIRAGRTNTCSVKNRCSVPGPTTGPPCRSSLMNMPSCCGGVKPAILIVTSVAK